MMVSSASAPSFRGIPRSFAQVLASLLLASRVAGHGQLTKPLSRPDFTGARESWQHRAPTNTIDGPRTGAYTGGAAFSDDSYICHDFTPSAEAPETTLTAGQSFPAQWKMEAGHPGDCYMYLSYDTDKDKPRNWFKFWALLGCGSPDLRNIPGEVNVDVPLPAEVPACDHCVLRWEWTAHQQVSNIEFYVTCADVRIVSSAPPTKPTPMVAISSTDHLPQTADGYRKAYSTPPEEFLVGPTIATYSACSEGSAGCIGTGTPSPTAAPSPSEAPAPSQAPTPATEPAPAPCTAGAGNCRETHCCQDPGYACFEKDDEYAECINPCDAGWSCILLGHSPTPTTPAPTTPAPTTPAPTTSAPTPTATVAPTPVPPATCTAGGGNCRTTHCCQDPGYICFEKNTTYARCIEACGEDWTCQVLTQGSLVQVSRKRHGRSFLSPRGQAVLTPALMQRGSNVCHVDESIAEEKDVFLQGTEELLM